MADDIAVEEVKNKEGDDCEKVKANFISDEAKTKAEDCKEQANEFFKKQEYDRAIDLYSEAINLNPSVAVYYGNRSFAYLKTECFGYALSDATKAIELDKSYLKGYYRRAAAYMSLGKFKQALKDYEAENILSINFEMHHVARGRCIKRYDFPDFRGKALIKEVTKCKPNDKDAKSKFLECSKIIKRIAFEKAIAVEDTRKPVAETIDLDSMTIDDDYQGPVLENDQVTIHFMISLIKTFREQKKLHRKFAYKILLEVMKIFKTQPSLIDITIPPGEKFTVCGDIHGQFYDLLHIFDLNGFPSEKNPYLFNGDFVDRGSFSVECILILFGFKLLYPNHFYMSRGNHESQTMNQMYGFEGEVKTKYSAQMVELFTEVFNWLPLAHCLNKKCLVMHGGLFSRDDVTLEEIRNIERHRQPPEDGVMCELLWSDPQPQIGRAPSKRGVGVQFGPDVTNKFLELNHLDYIIRSHEVKAEGYEVCHDNKCVTVFSAPNYCDVMGNKASFITMTGDDLTPKFTTYDAVPHPNVKPMAYANALFNIF